MYGIYGFPRFRWYSFECAKAITAWGREYIKMSIKEAEKFAKAPIKKQLNNWVNEFEIPKSNIEHYKKAIIEEKFNAFKKWAINEIESL